MPSVKNFQNSYRQNAKTSNNFRQPKQMTKAKDIEGERRKRMIRWITFFRRNPHRFVEMYFGIKLFPYQVIMLYLMQKSNFFYAVASRAAAKSWLIAVWALTLAVLYPGSQIIICASTIRQGGIILSEKMMMLRDAYVNVAREIKSITCNMNNYEAVFHNGSTIKVVPSAESSRGNRATMIIVEESRLVGKDILEGIIKPFLYSRKPPYAMLPQYMGIPELIEEPRTYYITSAWFKSEYWFSYVKQVIKRMVGGDPTSNFIAFDYLISIFHGIKTKTVIETERQTVDPITFSLEYENIPAGSSSKSYYKLSMFPRNMKKAFYPQRADTYSAKRNPYDIKKVDREIRIVSVDIATRANRVNDNSIIACTRLIPTHKGYERGVVYLESHHGENTVRQATRIKEIFYDFEADYIVLDIQNAGISVYDSMTSITMNESRGIQYDAFTVMDSPWIDDKLKEELRGRTLALNALPVVFPISATQALNSQIAVAFRTSLQKKMMSFLATDTDAEEFLIKTNKEFLEAKDDFSLRPWFLHPYVQTNLLVNECINLEMNLVNGLVKLTELPGARKDRFTCISYMNYLATLFDQELLKESDNSDDWESLAGVTLIV